MTDAKFDVAPAIACPFCDAYRARVEKAEFEANVETEIADGAFMRMKDAESEVAALKHDIARHIQIAADLATENEGLRKDAERYRWLRSEDAGEGPNPVIEELWNELQVKLCREDRMDREVDAAMRLTGATKDGK